MALVNPVVQSAVQSVVQRVDDVRSLGLARQFGGAVAAYSLRDIGGGSKVIRIRRSSDNTEQDFSATQVSNGEVQTFVGAGFSNSGFVTKWYDQSGNNRHMVQTNTSEQPYLIANGFYMTGVYADVASSNDTMKNLQVTSDGVNADFGTNDWANGGTKLGLIYAGTVSGSAANTSTCVIWGGGRGVSSFQEGGLSLQVIKAGNDSFRLRNERQGLSPSGTTLVLIKEIGSSTSLIAGSSNNTSTTLRVNDSITTGTEEADLDVREDTALSLFGSYAGNGDRYYQRSTSGICKECYLYSGDNISKVETVAAEINEHYSIY